MARPESEMPSTEPNPGIGAKVIKFPFGARDINIEKGTIRNPGKRRKLLRLLGGMTQVNEQDQKEVEWFQNLQEDVEEGRKNAWYYPTLGKIVIIVATAAVVTEVGRGGKDIKHLFSMVKKEQTRQKR